MGKKAEFESIVTDVCGDLNDRMENLEAIKGRNFCNAVKLAVSTYSVLRVSQSSLPIHIQVELTGDMLASLALEICMALGLEHDDIKEAMLFAENITQTLETQGQRASDILKGRDDDQ